MRSDKHLTHPLNVTYLVVGLVFLGIAGTWALRTAGVVNDRGMGWLIPLLLVAAGAVGLLASTLKSLRRGRTAADAVPDEADDRGAYADDFDPGLTSFAVDDLDEKLERAARAASTGSTSTTVLDASSDVPTEGPTDIPTEGPTDGPTDGPTHQGEDR